MPIRTLIQALGFTILLASGSIGADVPDATARAESAAQRAEAAATRSEEAARRVEAAADRLERILARLEQSQQGRERR
jgi:hypothetical protein